MQKPQHRDPVDEAVDRLPCLAQLADGGIKGGGRQQAQADQRHKANGEIEAQDDFRDDEDQVEFRLHDVKQEMGEPIGKGGDSQHAPDERNFWVVEHPLQGGERQRDHQQADGPVANQVQGRLDGQGAELAGKEPVGNDGRRQQRQGQRCGLERRKSSLPVGKRGHGGSLPALP